MKSKGPQLVSFVLALLVLSIIGYMVTPPAVLQQATALFGLN